MINAAESIVGTGSIDFHVIPPCLYVCVSPMNTVRYIFLVVWGPRGARELVGWLEISESGLEHFLKLHVPLESYLKALLEKF